MRGQQVPGIVLHQASTPRSSNRTHLRITTNTHDNLEESVASEEAPSASYRPVTRSQTGTVIHPPDHLRY